MGVQQVLSTLRTFRGVEEGQALTLNSCRLTIAEIENVSQMAVADVLRGYKIEVDDGIIVVMPPPSEPHERAALAFTRMFDRCFSQLNPEIIVVHGGGAGVHVPPRPTYLSPDGQWSAAGVAVRPRVILEVNRRVCLEALHARKDVWFGVAQVQMVLLVHLYDQPQQLFEVWERVVPGGAPVLASACNFGDLVACVAHPGAGLCVGPGTHVVEIPTAPFFGPPDARLPEALPATLPLDMWRVWRALTRA